MCRRVQINVAIMELSMEPLKNQNMTTIWSYYTLLGIYLKESESEYKKDTCISNVVIALFTIDKVWFLSYEIFR
jgi:hypothetical protein